MNRRNHFDSTYRRVLWTGLAISLGAHALALAFGRFSAELPVPDTRSVRALEIVIPDEEQPVMEIVELDAYAFGTNAAPALSRVMGSPAPSKARSQFTTPGTVDESSYVMARASSAHLEYPIVPRPALTPMTVETSFAPMYTLPSEGEKLAKAESGSKDGDRAGGGGIRISIGTGGHCPLPSTTLINRRLPVNTTIGRSPLRPGGGIRIGIGGR